MSTRISRCVLWVALATSAAAGSARAQKTEVVAVQQGVSYRIAGLVVDPNGRPVADAEVAIVNADTVSHLTRSDSVGKFGIDGIREVDVKLRVRRLGFEAQFLGVHISTTSHFANVPVTLAPTAAELAPVVVEKTPGIGRPNPRLVGFKERAANNSFGKYIAEATIDSLHPQFASDALRSMSGVEVRSSSRRVGNQVRLRGCTMRGLSTERIGPLIWVDGVRLPGAEIDEVVSGPDIAAIEVYSSFAGVPAQYFDRTAVCGTILVWTKHR